MLTDELTKALAEWATDQLIALFGSVENAEKVVAENHDPNSESARQYQAIKEMLARY